MSWTIDREVPEDQHQWIHHGDDNIAQLAVTADDEEVWWVTRDGIACGAKAATGELVRKIRGAPGMILSTGHDPDHLLMGLGSNLMVWSRSKGGWAMSIDGGTKSKMTCVAALDADRVVTGHEDGGIRRWSLSKEKLERGQYKSKAYSGPIRCLTPDGQGGFISGATSAALWWTGDHKAEPVPLQLAELGSHGRIGFADVHGDRALIGGAHCIGIFDREGTKIREPFLDTTHEIRGALFTDAGVLIAGLDFSFELYFASEGNASRRALRGPVVTTCATDRERTHVFGGGYGTVAAYATQREDWETGAGLSKSYLRGGQRQAIVGSDEGVVEVWSAETGTRVAQFDEWQEFGRVIDASWLDDSETVMRITDRTGWVMDWAPESSDARDVLEDVKESIVGVGPPGAAILLCPANKPARYYAKPDAPVKLMPQLQGFGQWVATRHGWLAKKDQVVYLVDPLSLEIRKSRALAESPHFDTNVVQLVPSPDESGLLARTHKKLYVLSLADLDIVGEYDGAADATFCPGASDVAWILRDRCVHRFAVESGECTSESPELSRPRRIACLGDDRLIWFNDDGAVGILRPPA